jgi:hypothetical protein
MSFFLVVPEEGRGREEVAQLARIVGATRLSLAGVEET